jgi:signal transduction histidine kinase
LSSVKFIQKREVLLLAIVVALILSLTFIAMRQVYNASVTSIRSEFNASSALFLERVAGELEKGFQAARDVELYFATNPRMKKQEFSRFIRSYSVMHENRAFVGAAFEITGEARRLRAMEIMTRRSGRTFQSWEPDGVVGRALEPNEQAYFVSYYWSQKTDLDVEKIPDLTGLNLGYYQDINKKLTEVLTTGEERMFFFHGNQDPVSSRMAPLFIASPFKVNENLTMVFIQSIDIAALVDELRLKSLQKIEYVSISADEIEPDWGADGTSILISADGVVDQYVSGLENHWAFDKHQTLGNQLWCFKAYSDPAYFSIDYTSIFLTGLLGLSFVALVSIIVFFQMRRSGKVYEIVDKRTRALKEAHTELESHYKMLQEMNDEVNGARKAAEAANLAKSEFLATMSHELRTPLNAILGFSQILEEEVLGPLGDGRYKDYAKDIRSSGAHLLSIINDILDLAKLEAGRIKIERKPVDLRNLADGIVSLLGQQAEEKKLRFTAEISDEVPTLIFGDELRLRQILINLASNSLKFTNKGSVHIRIFAKRFKDGREGWIMEVQDTGIGIAEEKQFTLFDRFTQADATLARRHGGVGLGLAICRELVDRMEGIIFVRSKLNIGTTIRAHLPLDEATSDDEDGSII